MITEASTDWHLVKLIADTVSEFVTISIKLLYTKHRMGESSKYYYSWYLDLTPNEMFSLYYYPIRGKSGLPLCEEHGRQLELKEVVLFDKVATELSPS